MSNEETEGQGGDWDGAPEHGLVKVDRPEPASLVPHGPKNPQEVKAALAEMEAQADFVHGTMSIMQRLMKKTMQVNVHYGVIPGTEKGNDNPKPVLLKPGAELLLRLFNMKAIVTNQNGTWDPDKTKVVEYFNRRERRKENKTLDGFLRHRVFMEIRRVGTEEVIAQSSGTANSWEKKYWFSDPMDVDNTILQMAYKRALVQGVRQATASSGFFGVEEEMYARPDGEPAEAEASHEDTGAEAALEAWIQKAATYYHLPVGRVRAVVNEWEGDQDGAKSALAKLAAAQKEPSQQERAPEPPKQQSKPYIDI